MPRKNRGKPKPRKKAGNAHKVSDAKLKAALVKHDGLVAAAAREVGMARQSVHERIRNNTDFVAFMAKINTDLIGLAQSALAFQMEKKHDRASAEFVLKNLGREIGYGPQPEIPPPAPDNSRRSVIIQQLVVMLDRKAAAIHDEPLDITAKAAPVLNGHAAPAGKANGHANGHAPDPARQLLAAKKNGKL